MNKTDTKNWINFKELRSQLSFAQVLEFYGVKDLTQKGDQFVGFCPIPTHNGNRRTPSFSAHPEKGIFQCFGCGAKGNLLDFAVLMDGGNPERGLDVRKTALKLNKEFGRFAAATEERAIQAKDAETRSTEGKQVIVNEPLGFRLKDLDSNHPYLLGRGFTRETMDKFGVGFCSKGVFAGRIAIPLYNNEDQLIGYAGRAIDDKKISQDNPKYLFPSKRERDGEILEFHKSLFLYNGSRFKEPLSDLIIVEGFASVWWLTQSGYPESVAIMGSSFSDEQLALILELSEPTGRIWIFADGDSAGLRFGTELGTAITSHRLCRVVSESNRQPTDYSVEELQSLFGV
jgi:DNA primase